MLPQSDFTTVKIALAKDDSWGARQIPVRLVFRKFDMSQDQLAVLAEGVRATCLDRVLWREKYAKYALQGNLINPAQHQFLIDRSPEAKLTRFNVEPRNT